MTNHTFAVTRGNTLEAEEVEMVHFSYPVGDSEGEIDDDYFQDLATLSKHDIISTHETISLLCLLTVPTIDPIPIERFSEYVCDMLQDDKKKLIKEFTVSFSYTLSCIEHASIYISVYTVWEEHIIMCGNICMVTYVWIFIL